MANIKSIFGSNVFNEEVMKNRLPKEVYDKLIETINNGTDLDINVANAVASAMKDWAIEKGATHYSHWFQPMTGITAEKHDSFLSIQKGGGVILDFSGKELIKGEPDASSFPSGGLRATFEARGYTAWDPTSYAFIKDNVLFITSAFYSFSGEVLDMKTPLLRSTELIAREATRLLKLFGYEDPGPVVANVGAEQEYFLIDKEMFTKRRDLVFTGRTLFGAMPPKGQEMDDHYFGTIKPRVAEFMKELNEELWKVGVYAKTQHNEAAPAQHELAPLYSSANTATDHNQLTMELMKKIADKHGLACLLHEKPFDGVNGSGKHNNWSLSTKNCGNLFNHGKHPENNIRFLLFLCAVIKAVDDYQDLLRMTVATAGNDRRLGGNEAPPAIVSMFLGSELTSILDAISEGSVYRRPETEEIETGVHVLPNISADTTDRNRTSPFAFTGNKFEFRMLGSSMSVAGPNIVLNTIIADALSSFSDVLEKSEDFDSDVIRLMKDTMYRHRRIIFNGNNYSKEWVAEAEKRGLSILPTAVDAIPMFTADKNVRLFTKYGIYTRDEIISRSEIMLDNYRKTVIIEARTMAEMILRDVIPAANRYETSLCDLVVSKKNIGIAQAEDGVLEEVKNISSLVSRLYASVGKIKRFVEGSSRVEGSLAASEYIRDNLIPEMAVARNITDELETVTARECWPYPTYGDLLFGV